jgi:aspartate racemase
MMEIQNSSPGMESPLLSPPGKSSSAQEVKTAGIIGGMGHQATALFYETVNQYCLKKKLEAYPRLIINSVNTWAVTALLSEKRMDELGHFLYREISLVQENVDFVAMVCNSVHAVLDQLRARLSVPVMSICEIVGKAVARSGVKRVGLIGTTTTLQHHFYQEELSRLGIPAVTLAAEREKLIDTLIFREVLYGRAQTQMQKVLLESIEDLRRQGCEGVILACTELPLFVQQKDVELTLFPSTQLLAEAVVDECTKR